VHDSYAQYGHKSEDDQANRNIEPKVDLVVPWIVGVWCKDLLLEIHPTDQVEYEGETDDQEQHLADYQVGLVRDLGTYCGQVNKEG